MNESVFSGRHATTTVKPLSAKKRQKGLNFSIYAMLNDLSGPIFAATAPR